jgi:transcriptional regulator with PAS, ATPase and Fis domain
VIFLGESGTGKEVFAQQLHEWSGRRGAFQAVNCAAIPATLLESELFGYKRGAFSGAERDRPGMVRAADGGTLFLDEIGDMAVDAQAKVLRVLQSKEIIPLGATVPERVDVRIVCATHRDLTVLQREGRFRGDLFARLNEYSLRLPPLRERKEDIFQLCRAMLARHGRPDLGLTFPFMTGLLHYDWPFNVRELEATIKRGIALCEGPELDAAHLPDVIKDLMKCYGQRGMTSRTGPASSLGAASSLGSAAGPTAAPPRSGVPTADELRSLLRDHKGNVAAVGREYGKERMQVHRWMKRYGINVDDYR